MKIVCDNCATKYSIADEKVRGKVFKIRCKKCSHIIVVKGTEGGDVPLDAGGAAADAAPAEADAPAADGWHVVINGEQVGPLSPTEIRAKHRAGEIDAETFAWKEGFGDWQRLASIDEFSDLAAAAPSSSDATRRTGTDDLFGGGGGAEPALSAPGGDLFGSAPAGGDLFSGGQPAVDSGPPQGGGLFAQPSAEPAPSRRALTPGLGNQALPDAAAADGGKAMTGQRNENSVLFSLNNLQALASGGGSSKPAPQANSGVDNRPGFANSQTEGSGLIDIRAMAAATLSSSPSSNSDRGNHNNELPQFASAPVFSPIAAPILMPSAPSGTPGWVWPVVGLGVVTLLAIVGLGVFMINKANVTAQQATQMASANNAAIAAGTPAAATAPAAGTPAAAAAATAPAAAGGTPAGTAPAAGATTAPAPGTAVAANDKGDRKAAGKNDHKGSAKGEQKAAPIPGTKVAKNDTPTPAEPAAAPVSKPKKGGGGDDLDDLLNGATKGGGGKSSAPKEDRAAAASNDENLPEQLDKGAIVGGMGKVKGKVGACYEQYKVPGMANVAVTIGKNGRVSNATVAGAFAGTPTGDCVSKAVKSATFPQFKGSPQSINYPFMLR